MKKQCKIVYIVMKIVGGKIYDKTDFQKNGITIKNNQKIILEIQNKQNIILIQEY